MELWEVQELLSKELQCLLPETFILVPEIGVDRFPPEVQKFVSKFNRCSVVYMMSKISARELYLSIIEEIGNQAQFMRELLYTDYIDLAHLLTQDVEIGDIEVMAYKILKTQ